jgi:bifunctional non-homologous end joining protein LigD
MMKKSATKKTARRSSAAKRGSARKSPVKKASAAKTSVRKSRTKRESPLAAYHAKRDFGKTAEPEGRAHEGEGRRSLRFVIQKHAASHLHFDFRIELDGVMKSWAVPKGPSYDPSIRRLAMEVEDHPIEYNSFEGTIPQGQYGGGTVMIWDRGVYGPESGGGEDELRAGYERGDLKIVMEGTRMLGGWVLVRTRRDPRGRAQWLLIKHRDAFAKQGFDIVADANSSIVSGRTMEEIARRAPSRKGSAKRGTTRKAGTRRRASTRSA